MKILSLTCAFTLAISSYGFIEPLMATREAEEGQNTKNLFWNRELQHSSKKGKSGKAGKKGKSGSSTGKSGKSGGKRRDLDVLEQDGSNLVADKDTEGQFFERELYYSSKKGKSGKSGSKKGKSGKSGGKRRDLDVLEQDGSNLVADKDTEGQFFDRELYYSSKKGKSGKSGSKKGKSGKSGGKRRDLDVLEQDGSNLVADKDTEGQFFDRELYYSSKKGKSGKSGSKKGKSGKSGGKRS